jgi:4-hydroxyphenylpyruvate dioxygenase
MASDRVPIAIATNALGKSIAGHTIESKLTAAKRHGFDGVELAIECLEHHASTAGFARKGTREDQLRAAAADIRSKGSTLSLEIIALNPFGSYDGLMEEEDIESRLREAELWLQLCQILKAPILQVHIDLGWFLISWLTERSELFLHLSLAEAPHPRYPQDRSQRAKTG